MATETLTREDVQHDIQKALEGFAENALRREMEQLGTLVRQAIQETVGVSPQHKSAAAVSEKPAPRPLLFRKDLRIELSEVLNEWWAKAAPNDEARGLLVAGHNNEKASESDKKPPETEATASGPPEKQHSDVSLLSGRVTRSTTCTTVAGGSPTNAGSLPVSPCSFSLPLTSCLDLEDTSTPPANSPSFTPVGSPLIKSPTLTPAMSPYMGPQSHCFAAISSPYLTPAGSPDLGPEGYLDALPPSRASRKDWRKSFVDRATKTNRKVEYLHSSHGREAHEVNEVVEEAIKALEVGVKPHLVEDGLGGTYFIKDRTDKSIAVFKPRDEEPLAPNNPKVHAGEGTGSGLRNGVLVGEAAINEYASFLIDSACSTQLRAGIPPTALVKVANSVFHSANEDRRSPFRTIKDKVGSFQLFAAHDCISEDIGASRFPDDQVHRLAALDIRLCNTDRHSGNILVREQGGQVAALIPIDHGYALPGEIGDTTFEWLAWPAAKRPFSDGMRTEILSINLEAVEAMLTRQAPELRAECLSTLRTCTTLLQRGVEAGLTPFDIGSLMTRPTGDAHGEEQRQAQEQSVLEKMVIEARRQAAAHSVQQILERLIKEECQKVADMAGRE
jgi:hypothetical protein